jgi:hypothetical protein
VSCLILEPRTQEPCDEIIQLRSINLFTSAHFLLCPTSELKRALARTLLWSAELFWSKLCLGVVVEFGFG